MQSEGQLKYSQCEVPVCVNVDQFNICCAKVDGFNQETNVVYQYHGYFWHGCPECYNEDAINNVNHETMGDLYQKNQRKM